MRPHFLRIFAGITVCALAACTPGAGNNHPVTILPDVATANSGEPRLSTAADGTVIMSWLEPRDEATALRYAVLRGNAWESPVTVAAGDDWFINWADFPSVMAIDDSLWAAHWLQMAPDGIFEYNVAVSISADGGRSWQPAITPHKDATLSEHGFVSLYPDGDGVGVLWLDGRETLNDGGTTLRSTVVGRNGTTGEDRLADDLVCDCCQTDVAIGPDGPVAVYRNRTEDEIRDIYVMHMIDGVWQDSRPVAADGWQIDACPVNGPAIAARSNTMAVAWFTAAGDTPKVRLAFSADGAKSFGAAVDIAADRPLGRVGLLLDEDGVAIVSWLRQSGNGAGEILARAAFADGTLGPVSIIGTTAAALLSGFPQLAGAGDNVVVAWTDIADGESRVRALLIDKKALRAGLPADRF